MSNKFIWVRTPSGTTTYVDHRGDDANGDGSAQNPYKTIFKATTVAAQNTNILLGDGVWSGGVYGSKYFRFYGNSDTRLTISPFSSSILNNFKSLSINVTQNLNPYKIFINDSFIKSLTYSTAYRPRIELKRCILVSCNLSANLHIVDRSIIINWNANNPSGEFTTFTNTIILATNLSLSKAYYCNVTTKNLPNTTCINNSTTGQSNSDYFNFYSLDSYLADFTAKAGSANIGAGENGVNIGLGEGYPARATNDSSDIFSEANGATVRNVVWSSALNGYVIAHKDKICLGSTSDTITLASDAEATDDYYNGLFIGITSGSGYGEIHRITDYDGTTKVATIDGNWTTQPDTQSVYSITGSIVSATKDYGKLIRVKQNWAFCANMESWSKTDNAAYGTWKEFITTPLLNNGVWELRPCSNFRYEYSINGTDWYSNTELIAGTDTDNKTDGDSYGNASENYTPAVARATRLRYARFHIEIGFNIGEDVA